MSHPAGRPFRRAWAAWLLPLALLAACLDPIAPPPSGPERTLTVDVRSEGGTGEVLVDGVPYSGPVEFEDGTEVRVRAVPAAGSRLYDLAGCTVDEADAGTCTVRMDADRRVEVTFVAEDEPPPAVYELTVATAGDGTGDVLVDGEPYDGPVEVAEGDEVVVRAVPGDGSVVNGFTGCTASSGSSCTVVVDGPESVTVSFLKCEGCATVETRVEGAGAGWIRSADDRILCDDACGPYEVGEPLVLEAAPKVGSRFAGWSGACSGTASCTVSAAEGGAVATARFEPATGPTFGPVGDDGCGVAPAGRPCAVSVRGSGSTLVRALVFSLPSGAGSFRLDPDAAPTGLEPEGCYGAVGPERVAVVCDEGVRLDSLAFDLGLVRSAPDGILLAFSDISTRDADGRSTAVTAGALGLPGGPR